MIFTSYSYVVFLLGAFILHWLFPRAWRKPFLIAASYLFYCSWRWEFGFLLLALTLFNWAYGRFVLVRDPSPPKLLAGIAANLVPLLYFKYTGFALSNLNGVLGLLGIGRVHVPEILLPLGISFFTFQGIAYLVDVATGEEPFNSLLDFMLFKAMWPQLIAGPIVRPGEIRDQIATPRNLDYENVAEGSRRIIFGLFKKVVLADNLAATVDLVFLGNAAPNMVDSVVGMLGFGMQIYFDFSAYSEIAIGSGLLFGYKLPENFNWPYLASSPQEFWNRWHMTLSRWIRDYVFTPLTFASRRRPALGPLWLVLAMCVCGLWHGAGWTFVCWGLWHGILLVLNQTLLRPVFAAGGKSGRAFRSAVALILTFALVQIGWALFRASSMTQALDMLRSIVTFRGGLRPAVVRENAVLFVAAVFAFLWIAQLVSRFSRRSSVGDGWFARLRPLRPALYAALIVATIIADQEAKAFVYFQF